MKSNKFFSLLVAFFASLIALPVFAQGVVVYKKDGTHVVYPYEKIDSLVTYNYDEIPPANYLTFRVDDITFKMIAIEGGTFTMGATAEQDNPNDDEFPIHEVTLDDYYLGETEVTQELWLAVMGKEPIVHITPNFSEPAWTEKNGKGAKYPAYNISYEAFLDFIGRLTVLTGKNFRVPTEAEWEFAARGGNLSRHTKYSGSNVLADVAWATGTDTIHPVKQKLGNELGLYDMSGNVWEWCSDWYGTYPSEPQVNPTGPAESGLRVLRGGARGLIEKYCRVSTRTYCPPSRVFETHGFRLALSPSKK